uniref:non-specific serine/threonine protein kinase n=1 Tax=Cajanus cajan TaxID=3821 RepID=A0A151SUG3_CAJCA|nr:Serine/threonine-protein kinase-like protein ACR4 [Cajanus cajan]
MAMLNMKQWLVGFGSLVKVVVFSCLWLQVSSLGSMSSIATSYGDKGSVFCGLKSDGSHTVTCYGMNSAIIYGTPTHFPFLGLTGGDGFVCGLLMSSSQPYCWGSSGHVEMGVPQPMVKGAQYLEISAGDYHVCGLRKPLTGRHRNTSLVDCWGYNMTNNYVFDGQVQSISAGSQFNCGLFSQNRTVFCWGDESSSPVIDMIPHGTRFQKISAGGLLDMGEEVSISLRQGQGNNVDMAPTDPMLSVVGGKFHACGIKSYDHGVVCWGYSFKAGTPVPRGIKVFVVSAGNYFTCGILVEKSLVPVCWGVGFPSSLPLPASPRMCRSTPCPPSYYETPQNGLCKSPGSHVCMPCSPSCPPEMYQRSGCNLKSDILCEYNCSICSSPECLSNCSSSNDAASGKKSERFWSMQLPVVIAEIAFAVFLVSIVPDLEEFKIRRAQMFPYEELERATSGFKEESIVGKGSFSCVFKGVLKDGTVVAVKRAIMSPNVQKNSKEFHTELDLLSRLNHAHLLNLLGYCEEGGERLLVYEYMAHGSLHQHLHGNKVMKEQLDWVRRVTIAVQAARGIEYLHGYACPPVIHRDIKSSNILIDEEHNARVADFGLSLLGPADSSSPLAELPAGTLGYLDPEYYRLHYLTTKSDVYSFGVLLLEILSGRKAIDMQYEEGNIVQWAVPLIKSGDIDAILDPVLKPPPDLDALRRIANVACKSVRMRGKDRPSMDKVTTVLERALAQLMGSPCIEQPILPTEVVLGSNRLHKKSSQRSSNRSESTDVEDQRFEFRAPSWITFPSVTSSQRRSGSEADVEGKNIAEGRHNVGGGGDVLRSLEEEIGLASPQERLFLQHNF